MAIDPNLYWKYLASMPKDTFTQGMQLGTENYNKQRLLSNQRDQTELERQRNAQRNAFQELQMEQIRKEAARNQQEENALKRVASTIQNRNSPEGFAAFDRAGAETPYDYAKQELAPYLGTAGFLASNKQESPDFQIVDGQYVDKSGGGAAPIPGFREDPNKDLDKDYVTFLRANGLQNSPQAYKAWDNHVIELKKAGATKVEQTNSPEGTRTWKDESDLRKEVNALPEIKDWTLIDGQVKRLDAAMEEARKGGNNVAVDQALITIFNKMLDPSSVVRESEYARTPGDLAVLSRIKGQWDKISSGGAGLSDPDRVAIYNMAKKYGKVAQRKYNETKTFYEGIAKRNNFDVENIFPKYEEVNNDPLGLFK